MKFLKFIFTALEYVMLAMITVSVVYIALWFVHYERYIIQENKMSLQVVRIKDLIEKPNELPAFNNLLDTTKIYKLVNVIDAVGETIGFPEEIDVVVEVSEIKK